MKDLPGITEENVVFFPFFTTFIVQIFKLSGNIQHKGGHRLNKQPVKQCLGFPKWFRGGKGMEFQPTPNHPELLQTGYVFQQAHYFFRVYDLMTCMSI